MTETPHRSFQIFAKPVGARCNLHCSYCYYLQKTNLYPRKHQPVMDDELLRQYISQHIEATTENLIMFSWHGGEPLLAGVDFYQKAIEIQQELLPQGKSIINGIQTNGTLLNEEWCNFLARNNFMVGISLDGPEEFHDRFRKGENGSGSFRQVFNGLKLLQKYNIPHEVLCVVNAQNVNFPLKIYRFFKEQDVKHITFLPLVEQQPDNPDKVSHSSVPAAEFGRFLTVIFDEWAEKDIGEITVQIFEEAISTAFRDEHTLCVFKKECGGVPVVEHNGDFYSCDHYVDRNHLVGNIKNRKLAVLLDSPEQKAFGKAKRETLPGYCRQCPVLNMCNGECPKNRFISSPDGEQGLNYLCEGYRQFFTHISPFVTAVKQLL